jgi:RNA polymerase sigma-70 factor (ECF subfamily)
VREPEPETIDRARKGDLRAFESLVRDYQADVWRLAYHHTPNPATAEDVTQEAFFRAFRGLHSYKGQAKFTSWLLRIVRNCAVDTYRKTRKETPTDTQFERAERAGSSPAAEERTRINEAIRRLPLSLREPFVTIEVLGYSYQEASVILGLRVGTVKSRMHRARAALIASLSDREAAGEM